MAEAAAVLYVKDVQRMTAFYAGVLALPVIKAEPTWARLANAAFELIVHGMPPALSETIEISSPPERRADTPIKLCFTVADIAAARAQAAQLGGALDPPASEWQWDALRICDGIDPEGNVFQLRMRA